MNRDDKNRIARIVQQIIVVLLIIAVFWLMRCYKLKGLDFVPLAELNLFSIISSLFVIAVFMERSIEGLLIPARSEDRQRKVNELESKKQEFNESSAEFDKNQQKIDHIEDSMSQPDANPEDFAESLKALNKRMDGIKIEKKELREKVLKIEDDLNTYDSQTRVIVTWFTFVFGITISLAGVRVLSGLVVDTELKALEPYQQTLFNFVDVILTGGVIAGGSAAIDKLGRKISNYLGTNKKNDPAPSA